MVLNKYKANLLLKIITIFCLSKLGVIIQPHGPEWDESVYLSMGKFIFSGGTKGLWEPLRPILIPLILSPFSFLGPSRFFLAAEIIMLIFSVGVIVYIYRFTNQFYTNTIAIIAIIILIVTPNFYRISTSFLTCIPALFFFLLSIDFLLKQRFIPGGIFIGLSFLARFPSCIFFIGISVTLFIEYYVIQKNKKQFIKALTRFIIGFFIIATPFFIFNGIFYSRFFEETMNKNLINNIFYPIITGSEAIVGLSGNPLYYFIFPVMYNPVLIGFPLFICLILCFRFKSIFLPHNTMKAAYLIIPTFFMFIFFSIINNKQVRFINLFLPLYILTSAVSFHYLIEWLTKRKVLLMSIFILLLVPCIALNVYYTIVDKREQTLFLNEMKTNPYLKQGETIYSCNPKIAAYWDILLKPMYYDFNYLSKIYNQIPAGSIFILDRSAFHRNDKRIDILFKKISEKNKPIFVNRIGNSFIYTYKKSDP